MSAVPFAPGGAKGWRVLLRAVAYELHKSLAFRAGFLVREVLRGVHRPLVMILVYRAIFDLGEVQTIRGFTFGDLVSYLILVAVLQRLIFLDRGLDLADQIFDGTLTKFLVMPIRFYWLPLGKFVHFTLLQLGFAGAFYALGAVLVPAHWPTPVSPLAACQALVLIVLGSYCTFLAYYLVNLLAFWLDVVWTLLVMARFVFLFASGAILPVATMPDVFQDVLRWSFPYWTLSAPIELWLGRLSSADWMLGVLVLVLSAALLELVRQVMWRRGLARYVGSGM